jgi:predicted transcriptional regulator
MTYEITLHSVQATILHALLMRPSATFAQLQKTSGLTSDHFTFHIKRLVAEGYIEQNGNDYRLSAMGKEFANRMDTDDKTIERQPKVAVVLIIENAQGEFVAQQRLKQPYYGGPPVK